MVNLNKFIGFFALLGVLVLFSGSVEAENHTVLVSQSDDFSSYFFDPVILEVEVGDNVTFVWGNGSHNVAKESD